MEEKHIREIVCDDIQLRLSYWSHEADLTRLDLYQILASLMINLESMIETEEDG